MAKAKPNKKRRKPGPKSNAKGLTPKMLKFTKEYTKDLNAGQAAKRAGYKNDKHAPALVRNPSIKAAVAQVLQRQFAKIEADGEKVVRELGRLALSDIRRMIAEDGTVIPVHLWDDDTAAAVESIQVEEHVNPLTGEVTGYTKRVKLWSKNGAIDTLMKYFRLMPDSKVDVHLSGQVNHLHAHGLVKMDDLKPSLETAKQIMTLLENRNGSLNGDAKQDSIELPVVNGEVK